MHVHQKELSTVYKEDKDFEKVRKQIFESLKLTGAKKISQVCEDTQTPPYEFMYYYCLDKEGRAAYLANLSVKQKVVLSHEMHAHQKVLSKVYKDFGKEKEILRAYKKVSFDEKNVPPYEFMHYYCLDKEGRTAYLKNLPVEKQVVLFHEMHVHQKVLSEAHKDFREVRDEIFRAYRNVSSDEKPPYRFMYYCCLGEKERALFLKEWSFKKQVVLLHEMHVHQKMLSERYKDFKEVRNEIFRAYRKVSSDEKFPYEFMYYCCLDEKDRAQYLKQLSQKQQVALFREIHIYQKTLSEVYKDFEQVKSEIFKFFLTKLDVYKAQKDAEDKNSYTGTWGKILEKLSLGKLSRLGGARTSSEKAEVAGALIEAMNAGRNKRTRYIL